MTGSARATFAAAASVLVSACVGIGCGGGSDDEPEPTVKTESADGPAHVVTPVTGTSWIEHLDVSFEDTRMGQMGGSSPPSDTPRQEPSLEAGGTDRLGTSIRRFFELFPNEGASRALDEPFVLSGEDLYRLDCQSCHGPEGEGAPPEIDSLRGPVEGTWPTLILRRMRERGTPVDTETAQELAAQAEKALRDRLTHGGEKMPPFPHLEGEELEALLGYLKSLVGAPEAEGADLRVTESAARVGEHLVKGTCHVCHDATGPGGGHMMMRRPPTSFMSPSATAFPEHDIS